jgi:hypothetical protein
MAAASDSKDMAKDMAKTEKEKDKEKENFTESERNLAIHLMKWGIRWDSEMNINCDVRVLKEKAIVNLIQYAIAPPPETIHVGNPETGEFESLVRPFQAVTTFAVFCRAIRCYRPEMKEMTLAKGDKKTLAALRCVLQRLLASGMDIHAKFEHPLDMIEKPTTILEIAKELPVVAELLSKMMVV